MGCTPQLSDAEVVSITKSVWGYEIAGNNWVGRKARASTDREELLSLSRFPPGAHLLMLLRVSHPKLGDCFAIDQTKTAELLQWERNTIRTAIRFLLKDRPFRARLLGRKGQGRPSSVSTEEARPWLIGTHNIIKHPSPLSLAPKGK